MTCRICRRATNSASSRSGSSPGRPLPVVATTAPAAPATAPGLVARACHRHPQRCNGMRRGDASRPRRPASTRSAAVSAWGHASRRGPRPPVARPPARVPSPGAGAGPRPGGEGRAEGARGGAGRPLRADRPRARLRRPAPPSRARRPRSVPGLRRPGRVDGSRRRVAGGRVRRVRRWRHVPHGRACPRAPTRRPRRVPRPRAARAAERRAVRVVGGRGACGGPRAPVRPRRRARGALPRGRGGERGHGPGGDRRGLSREPRAALGSSSISRRWRFSATPMARPRCASRCA